MRKTKLFNLDGKIAFITGGARGLGFAMARGLAEAGAQIFFNARSQESVDNGIREFKKYSIEATGFVCDVADEPVVKERVSAIEDKYGAIDILVNNAGIINRVPMLEMQSDDFRHIIDIDLVAPFTVAKAVLPAMIKKGHGKIINTCGIMSEVGRETASAYASAKGGLKMLTRNIASEFGRFNIQCNGIGPGYMATSLNSQLRETQPDGSRQIKRRERLEMPKNKIMSRHGAVLKFLVYSLFGIFMFFCPVTIRGNSTIPVDHIISFIRSDLLGVAKIYILIVMYCGAALPFIHKSWNKDAMTIFFSSAKVCGAIIGTILYFGLFKNLGWLWRPDFGSFLFNALAVPVGLVIPIGSVFLAFLANFGLMEFTGVIMTPVMRPVFRTPGRSAIDAVASFVGSYSIALIITNNMYRQGKYSTREAAIIATGFSTVSATFLLIVAKTLDIMNHWTLFFWVSLIVTFITTAVTAYIWPLRSMPETYYKNKPDPDPVYSGNRFKHAWETGIKVAGATEPVGKMVIDNVKSGLNMAFAVIPSITSVGLLGLMLAEYTPIFDWFGYIFYPFFRLFGISQALLAGKAVAMSLPEMFLPSLLIAKTATPLLKFVIAVISISEILFFSASIPCLMGTDIPLKLLDIVIIWFERVVISIIVTVPIAMALSFSDIIQAATL